ncbi:tetratricopeptide repeat protein [Streptomyces sp. NPDC005281]|uniref:tetratricopeptide repeat protein n=1 Tax=Streptomyces sp. NPDC005281 TaxID=3155712 RepID=UPI0033B66120
MLTEAVRAGTWRKLGDHGQIAAAFERALALDPTNWSLYLDLADLHAEQGDFRGPAHRSGAGARADRGHTSRGRGHLFRRTPLLLPGCCRRRSGRAGQLGPPHGTAAPGAVSTPADPCRAGRP